MNATVWIELNEVVVDARVSGEFQDIKELILETADWFKFEKNKKVWFVPIRFWSSVRKSLEREGFKLTFQTKESFEDDFIILGKSEEEIHLWTTFGNKNLQELILENSFCRREMRFANGNLFDRFTCALEHELELLRSVEQCRIIDLNNSLFEPSQNFEIFCK